VILQEKLKDLCKKSLEIRSEKVKLLAESEELTKIIEENKIENQIFMKNIDNIQNFIQFVFFY